MGVSSLCGTANSAYENNSSCSSSAAVPASAPSLTSLQLRLFMCAIDLDSINRRGISCVMSQCGVRVSP